MHSFEFASSALVCDIMENTRKRNKEKKKLHIFSLSFSLIFLFGADEESCTLDAAENGGFQEQVILFPFFFLSYTLS